MRQYHIPEDSPLGESLAAYRRLRARRANTEAVEQEYLQRVLRDAKEQNLSLRQIEALTGVSRPTLARKYLKKSFGAPLPPPIEYDEDEWVAAMDEGREPTMRDDRGPFAVEGCEECDGQTAITRLTLGAARMQDSPQDWGTGQLRNGSHEPLQGITEHELNHLLERGVHDPQGQRIVRHLARAVLRVLHPEVSRTGAILDAAVEGVRKDLRGAMVLVGQAGWPEGADRGWMRDVRTRRARGFYLPDWGEETADDGKHY